MNVNAHINATTLRAWLRAGCTVDRHPQWTVRFVRDAAGKRLATETEGEGRCRITGAATAKRARHPRAIRYVSE